MTEQELQELSDSLEIQSLKALCMEIIDNVHFDPEDARAKLSNLFVDDIKADYGPAGLFEGRDAVLEFLVNISAKPAWLWHSLHSPRIEVSGDIATGYWTMNGQGRMPDSDQMVASINRCRDDFRRTADGWKISYIRSINEG